MATKYEFGGILYRTQADMLRGIALAYWTSNGNTTWDGVFRQFAAPVDGFSEAEDCISGWGLNRVHDYAEEDEQSHMDFNGYTEADLAAAMVDAFAEIRATVEAETEADA